MALGVHTRHARGASGWREDKNHADVRITTDYEKYKVLDGTYTAFSVSVSVKMLEDDNSTVQQETHEMRRYARRSKEG